ncbi:MAG TPA: ribulose-phosphate 3-epimerase [Candidatus Eisenbacteria bacterium]
MIPDRPLIAPSILSADFTQLAEQIHLMETAGAQLLHLDVMDGHFVPNITFGPMVVEAVNRITPLFLDVHLMIAEPQKYAEAFVKAGADRLLVQIETQADPVPLLDRIRGLGAEAGLVLNPETPFEAVEPHLAHIDCLLVMSVHPGFGGQAFMAEVLPKVQKARALREMHGWDWPIEIDGGIDSATVVPAVEAGTSILVAGNAIYKYPDPSDAFTRLRLTAELAGESSGRPRGLIRTDEGFL